MVCNDADILTAPGNFASDIPSTPAFAENGVALNNLDGLPVPDASEIPGIPGASAVHDVSVSTSVPEIPPIPDVPEAPAVPEVPNIPGVPLDATGDLTAPGTPVSKPKKRKRILRRGQKCMRKGRTLALSKPVLNVALGRQLGPPVADALKTISKGLPLDQPDLSGVTGTAPVPAPVPV